MKLLNANTLVLFLTYSVITRNFHIYFPFIDVIFHLIFGELICEGNLNFLPSRRESFLCIVSQRLENILLTSSFCRHKCCFSHTHPSVARAQDSIKIRIRKELDLLGRCRRIMANLIISLAVFLPVYPPAGLSVSNPRSLITDAEG